MTVTEMPNVRFPFLFSALIALAALALIAGCGDSISGTDRGGGGGGGGGGGNPPIASFTASHTTGDAPVTVLFTDKSSGSITSRTWDFGDRYVSTGTNPQHTYTAPGKYTVELTVSGPDGSDSKTSLIVVSEIVTVSGQTYYLVPTRTGGDCEFAGHGPVVSFRVDLATSNKSEARHRLLAYMSMSATETRSDWTSAAGQVTKTIYTVGDENLYIKDIVATQTSYSNKYEDTDHDYDVFHTLIGRISIMGDTSGDDVCGNTTDDTHMAYAPLVKVRLSPR